MIDLRSDTITQPTPEMRQAIANIAAGALYALRHHRERLAEDHKNAKALATQICYIPGIELKPETAETNIVIFRLTDTLAPVLVEELKQHGILVMALGPDLIRIVTNLMVSHEDIVQTASILKKTMMSAKLRKHKTL